jgi:hypothetical protein
LQLPGFSYYYDVQTQALVPAPAVPTAAGEAADIFNSAFTGSLDGSAEYPEIGTGLVLPDAPNTSGTDVVMIITPDGGTLLLAGTSNVIATRKPPG